MIKLSADTYVSVIPGHGEEGSRLRFYGGKCGVVISCGMRRLWVRFTEEFNNQKECMMSPEQASPAKPIEVIEAKLKGL